MANRTLAFEIGTEELPAFDLHDATKKLPAIAAKAFDDAKIPHGDVEAYNSPRRLIVIVRDVPEKTAATDEEFRGPAARIAFDADGNPTKAALGFARGKGVDVSALERRTVKGADYVFAVKHTPACDVAGLLPALLSQLIVDVPWPKTQRWGAHTETFSRPVRWLVALFGDEVVPVEYAGVVSGNKTFGHRVLAPGAHEVPDADQLLDVLRAVYVIPSEDERERIIREQVKQAEQKTGLVADLPAHTMREVVNLAEYPTVMVGTFDESFLAVPKEITVDAMLVHQRYFPLFNQDKTLANKFLITANGDPAFAENIVDGNQRVVAARLYDAKFFYDEDLKHPLEYYTSKLDSVVFQEDLGTLAAKSKRIVRLADALAAEAHLSEADAADARRAAKLCKADLVTGAVVEFTSVQGVMGSYYARAEGDSDQVADAIADQYRPRFAGDDTPRSLVGKVVATADKLDTICGLFAVDQAPTGSSDPFALRRGAIGILAMLEDGMDVKLLPIIDEGLRAYQDDGIKFDADTVRAAIIDFFVTRTRVVLRDRGIAADTIDAVLAAGVEEPLVIVARAQALENARANEPDTFNDLAVAFARANNLRDAKAGTAVDESLLGDTEKALLSAVDAAQKKVDAALAADDYASALGELASLRDPIDRFFAEVMVMDKDEVLRANRLRLLNRFADVFASVADFAKMAKAGK